MKRSIAIWALNLAVAVATLTALDASAKQEAAPSTALAESDQFNQKMNELFRPSDQNSDVQQAVFASVEMIGAYKLDSIIPRADRYSIQLIQAQLKTLRHTGQSGLTLHQRAVKKRELKQELKSLEGGITKRLVRGTARLLVNATQAFLVIDVASRTYVMNIVERDPGLFTSYTLFCGADNCEHAIRQFIKHTHYIKDRANIKIPTVTVSPPEETEQSNQY